VLNSSSLASKVSVISNDLKLPKNSGYARDVIGKRRVSVKKIPKNKCSCVIKRKGVCVIKVKMVDGIPNNKEFGIKVAINRNLSRKKKNIQISTNPSVVGPE
jgi:hypothetical protein